MLDKFIIYYYKEPKILTAQNTIITSANYEIAITLSVNIREDTATETLEKLSQYYHQGLFIEGHK